MILADVEMARRIDGFEAPRFEGDWRGCNAT